jgi:hypothetical protein
MATLVSNTSNKKVSTYIIRGPSGTAVAYLNIMTKQADAQFAADFMKAMAACSIELMGDQPAKAEW